MGCAMTWHTGVVDGGDEAHPRLEEVSSITVPATGTPICRCEAAVCG